MKNMLRYKTKPRPGLVALYDIRPGNGAGPFLQPRSPHGAERQGNTHTHTWRQTDRQTHLVSSDSGQVQQGSPAPLQSKTSAHFSHSATLVYTLYTLCHKKRCPLVTFGNLKNPAISW